MNPPLTIIKVESIGVRTVNGFRDYSDGTGDFGPVKLPVFPESPRGESLREIWRASKRSTREFADLLGLRPLDVIYLQQGNYTLSDEDWERLFVALKDVVIG